MQFIATHPFLSGLIWLLACEVVAFFLWATIFAPLSRRPARRRAGSITILSHLRALNGHPFWFTFNGFFLFALTTGIYFRITGQ